MREVRVYPKFAYILVLCAYLSCAFTPTTTYAKCPSTVCATLEKSQLGKHLMLRALTKVREVKPKNGKNLNNWDAHALVPLIPIYDTTACPKETVVSSSDWLYIETDQNTGVPRLYLWLHKTAKLVTLDLSEIGVQNNGFEAWRSTKPSTTYGDYDYFVYYADDVYTAAGDMEKEYVVEIFPPKDFASDGCNAERPDSQGVWSKDWKSKMGFLQISSGSGSEPNH